MSNLYEFNTEKISFKTRMKQFHDAMIRLCKLLPDSLITLIARFSIAAIFWKSGQTKIEGLSIDIVSGNFNLSWPRLSESVIPLFQDEYRLPIIPAEVAAMVAALAEHLFPVSILFGLATRISSLALLAMTFVIQIFVYPDAYPTHGVWTVALLFLITHGPGKLSVDYWISKYYLQHPNNYRF